MSVGCVPTTTAAQRELVRRGYDAISLVYRNDVGLSGDEDLDRREQYVGWVAELASLLTPGARVLDLGCGCGVPATKALVQHGFDVLGLDFSASQIARARQLVPGASFVEADMATWEAEPSSFDAVTSFYALIHVPLADQRRVLALLSAWLRPGGWAMLTVGSAWWRGVGDFFGAPMFWDHADRATYLQWLGEVGFQVVWDRFIPEGDGGHVLVLAGTAKVRCPRERIGCSEILHGRLRRQPEREQMGGCRALPRQAGVNATGPHCDLAIRLPLAPRLREGTGPAREHPPTLARTPARAHRKHVNPWDAGEGDHRHACGRRQHRRPPAGGGRPPSRLDKRS